MVLFAQFEMIDKLKRLVNIVYFSVINYSILGYKVQKLVDSVGFHHSSFSPSPPHFFLFFAFLFVFLWIFFFVHLNNKKKNLKNCYF